MIKIITAPDTELIKRIYALYSAEIVRYTATLTRFRERLMLDCGAVVLTDETDGLLHGFAVVYRDGLLMLLVERSCRRQGVGARLLAECERLAVPCGKLMLGHGSSGRYLYCGALIQSESFPAGEPDMTDDTSRFLTSHGYSNSWIAADCLLELSGFHPRENECGDIEIRTRRDNERDEAFLLGNLVSHWGENYRDAGELIGAFLHDCKRSMVSRLMASWSAASYSKTAVCSKARLPIAAHSDASASTPNTVGAASPHRSAARSASAQPLADTSGCSSDIPASTTGTPDSARRYTPIIAWAKRSCEN